MGPFLRVGARFWVGLRGKHGIPVYCVGPNSYLETSPKGIDILRIPELGIESFRCYWVGSLDFIFLENKEVFH